MKTESAALSKWYTIYVAYECILINLVGFLTLFFQCELQSIAASVKTKYPDVAEWKIDSVFGHYWLQGDQNCSTRGSHCLTYMVAGWLMIGE